MGRVLQRKEILDKPVAAEDEQPLLTGIKPMEEGAMVLRLLLGRLHRLRPDGGERLGHAQTEVGDEACPVRLGPPGDAGRSGRRPSARRGL